MALTRSVDISEFTVAQAQSGFASATFTAEELTQAYVDRIATYNPYYNAIILFNANALADARALI